MPEQSGAAPRVVVTAVGATTAQGPTAQDFWSGVRDGRVAIRPVKRIPMDAFRTRLAGEVQESSLRAMNTGIPRITAIRSSISL